MNKDARLWTEQVPDRIEHDGDGVRSDACRERREQNEADAENGDGRSVTAHRTRFEAILGELFDE